LDHHCIFINNCVGYRNHHYFLLLLLTTAILTTWATYIGICLLSNQIRNEIPSWKIWGESFTWLQYANIWAWALQEHTRIGAVSLLCAMTTPLVWGLFSYHMYLIWAGTTTNESQKWSDWAAEMTDGSVFKRSLPTDRQKDETLESAWTRWPVESEQIVLRTEDGLPPRGLAAIGVGEWQRVWRLAEVENLYDLGFWDNLNDVFWPRYSLRRDAFTGSQRRESIAILTDVTDDTA
jgi:palmitoyltransferase